MTKKRMAVRVIGVIALTLVGVALQKKAQRQLQVNFTAMTEFYRNSKNSAIHDINLNNSNNRHMAGNDVNVNSMAMHTTKSYSFQEIVHAKNSGVKIVKVMSNKSNSNSVSPAVQVKEDADYEITTTNYGWNTPADFNFSRHMVSGEFFNATLKHDHYNAKTWTDANATNSSNKTMIAFMDVDTCLEFLYPKYIKRRWWLNMDNLNDGRYGGGGYLKSITDSCPYLHQAAQSPALTSNPNNRLVILNCFGWPKQSMKIMCQDLNNNFTRDVVEHPQVVFAGYSETKRNAVPNKDLGLPPPAIKPVILTEEDRAAIASCQQRKYLFSFQGRGGYGRERLMQLQNETNFFVRIENQGKYHQDLLTDDKSSTMYDTLNYRDLLLNSTFGGTPRGDALYSFRFTETMSAGTIPVVYADDWLPPFNDAVINWTEAAVFIPEADMLKTPEILRAIPPEKICQMQQNVIYIYDNYLANREGWVRGLTQAALAQSNILLAPPVGMKETGGALSTE